MQHFMFPTSSYHVNQMCSCTSYMLTSQGTNKPKWYPPFKRIIQMTALVFPLNWKRTMLVKSYIPCGMLPLTGVKHCCLMYTHGPSAFTSIIPLSKPPSHALFPRPHAVPLYLLNTSFTLQHFSTWAGSCNFYGGGAHRAAVRRGPLYFHCTHHAPANEGHLDWNELTGKMT